MSDQKHHKLAPFDLHIHFEGAFAFVVETANSDTSDDAPITGVKVYGSNCDHLHAVTINEIHGAKTEEQATYMLENYWHCIDPKWSTSGQGGDAPSGMQLGDLKAKLKDTSPVLRNTRPVSGGWTIAMNLPVGPQGWNSYGLVNTENCFGGRDGGMIPASVATIQEIVYFDVLTYEFHGACFEPAPKTCPATNQVEGKRHRIDIHITSEMPNVIPTQPHQSRAVASMSSMLGLDLVFQKALPTSTAKGNHIIDTAHTAVGRGDKRSWNDSVTLGSSRQVNQVTAWMTFGNQMFYVCVLKKMYVVDTLPFCGPAPVLCCRFSRRSRSPHNFRMIRIAGRSMPNGNVH